MSGLIDGVVVQAQAGGVPALLDLRVDIVGAVEIGVDLRQDGRV